jgi:hypothetical protein
VAEQFWILQPVDPNRPHFEVIHSLYKQNAARVGWNETGSGLALEFLLKDDQQSDEVRAAITADLTGKLERLYPEAGSVERLMELLEQSCYHLSNMYTEVHWFPIKPHSTT